MKIRPRQDLLEIWRSVAEESYRDGAWRWGGRWGRNSVSDAEQLLCILFPATQVSVLRLDNLDEISRDALRALRVLGNDVDVVRTLLDVMLDYFTTYLDDDGPTFPVGGYLEPEWGDDADAGPTEDQRQLGVVDSYSISVTLCLSVIGFLIVLGQGIENPRTRETVRRLRTLASDRLTAAMTGLVRSFTINVFEADSDEGRNLLLTVNQGGEPSRIVAARLSRGLRDIRARLRDEVTIGSVAAREALHNEARLFECGWSWGVVKDAGEVDFVSGRTPQPRGIAADRPYLYFTTVALDGIEDLFDARTRILGLLNDEQQRLAGVLQLRWELSLEFWTRVATFGAGRWPLEDVPWRTTDGEESDYFSLFVASVLVQRAVGQRASPEALTRIGRVLEDLASRGRITRRALGDEPAVRLHAPGVRLRLRGTEELGPPQAWAVTSYGSLLLKRTIMTADQMQDTEERDRMQTLGDVLWEHQLERRLGSDAGGWIWDQPAGAFPAIKTSHDQASWYHTERVVECLVKAAAVIERPPPASPVLRELVGEQLAEAERLFEQQLLNGSAQAGASLQDRIDSVDLRIRRARELREDYPASALVLVQDVLRDLEDVITARRSSTYAGPE